VDFLGSADQLAWARDNGCPWEAKTCSLAALRGHLEALQWARDNDCPWDLETCVDAALGGHLEVLRWAREHGCPWNEMTLCVRRWGRVPGAVAVGAAARLPVERKDVSVRGWER